MDTGTQREEPDHNLHVLQWLCLNDHNHHVLSWARGRHLRNAHQARERLRSVSTERLERLTALGFLDAYSAVAADQVIAERQRERRGSHPRPNAGAE